MSKVFWINLYILTKFITSFLWSREKKKGIKIFLFASHSLCYLPSYSHKVLNWFWSFWAKNIKKCCLKKFIVVHSRRKKNKPSVLQKTLLLRLIARRVLKVKIKYKKKVKQFLDPSEAELYFSLYCVDGWTKNKRKK